MKTKYSKRESIVGVLALILILTLSFAFVFGQTTASTADAASGDDGTWITVGEIYNDKTQMFDRDNLAALFEAITGGSSFDVVQYAAKVVTTSADFRTANGGNNIVVEFGGLKWNAVYLTTSKTGDVILDLWRSSDGLQGYNGLTQKNQATFSSDGWGANNDESEGTDKYPANMYSTSLIRVDKLNAGGNIAINKNDVTPHEQDLANQYARFTMKGDENGLVNGKLSLTEYIATPAQVSYQEDEFNEATAQQVYYTKYYYPNEAYGTPREGGSWGYGDYSNYSLQDSLREENEKYGAWKNDYLWLPSHSETGDDNRNRSGEYGIWETDTALLSNPSSYAWLRSAYSATTRAIALDGSGGWDDQYVSNTNWVRPALHLNLTKAVATTFFEYAIEYDANGGNGEIPKEYHMADERVTLPTDGVEWPGYTFLGWCKWKNSFSVIKSLAGERSAGIITSLTLTREQAEALPDNTQTLYALWAPDNNANGIADYREYKVVYNTNGGSSDPPSEEYHMLDETFLLSDGDGIERTGCIFLGWSEEKKNIIDCLEDESGIITAFTLTEEAFNKLSDRDNTFRVKTFYAVWAKDDNGNATPDYLETGTTIPELSVVVFGDMVVEYDGEPHKLQIDGDLPEEFKVTYEGNNGYDDTTGAIEPGIYTVTAIFTDGSDAEVARKTATLTVTKKKYDMAGVTFEDKTYTYDGAPHSLVIAGTLPAGVTVTYFGNGHIDVGVYEVLATFTIADPAHYKVPVELTATLTIEDNGRSLQGIAFQDAIVTYDGNEHSIFIEGTPADGISVTYTNNGQIDPGVYSVTAVFSDGAGKFAEMTATLTILQASLKYKDDNGNTTLVVDSADGFDPDLELSVERADDDITRTLWAWEKDALSQRYSVKFTKNGVEMPFDGKATVRLLIPEEFRNREFSLQSVGRASAIEYMRDGDYVIFEADGLSAYAFAVDGVAFLPIIFGAAAISLLGVGALIILAIITKKNKKGE